MRRMILLAAALVTLGYGSAAACVDPMSPWSVGVVFSDGVVFDLERLELAAPDTLSYLKTCTVKEAYIGTPIKEGEGGSGSQDPLTIGGVGVSVNTLRIAVEYGGGCKEHFFNLIIDSSLFVSEPAQVNLWLSHDANGDACKALVHDTLLFDLTSLGTSQALGLRVYAPAAAEPFSEVPLWTSASGAKMRLCSYKIRSAYSPAVMANIGNFDGLFHSTTTVNRILLIFDTTGTLPTEAEKAAAMEAELQRLAHLGVATLTDATIQKITAALTAQTGQYWTAEDSVLGFNMWFEGGSVNGVRGVYSAKGCGSGVSYELPVKSFEAVAVANPAAGRAVTPERMKAFVNSGNLYLRFPPVAGSAAVMLLSDMAGRRVAVLPVAKNSIGLSLPLPGSSGVNLSAGCFFAALREGNRTVQSCVVMVP
jgi:hypothetical protein